MTDSDKDELLLEKARGGSQEAFLELYQRHRGLIFRFLYRLLGSVPIAEDITHDCFVALLRNSVESSTSPSLRTQLYSAARSRAIERLPTVEMNASDVDKTHRVPVFDRDLGSRVAEAVTGLPPLERETLVLSEYEGLKLYEIAAIVGADVRTVVARLESAHQQLRNTLANHL